MEETAVDKYTKEQVKNDSQKDEKSSRIRVVYSDLKDFRDDFIRGAIVSGHCLAKNIPDEFKPKDKDLPDNIEGRLLIFFGNNQHKFTFSKYTGNETHKWTINNTGLGNYRDMLGDIWPEGGDIVWLIWKPELLELLNKKAEHICELSEPLLKIREYRSAVAKVRRIVRPDGHPWISKSNVEWSYPKQLDEKIDELNSVDAGTQKPARTEQNPTPAKWRRLWNWLRNHPHSYGLLTGVFFLIAFLIVGFLMPQWKQWCWGTAVVPLLILILSLLGGRSSQ